MTPQREDPPAGDGADGRYANYFELGYNRFEIVLAFGQRFESMPAGACHTRIVTSPSYAKSLLELLQQMLTQYEQRYGRIETE